MLINASTRLPDTVPKPLQRRHCCTVTPSPGCLCTPRVRRAPSPPPGGSGLYETNLPPLVSTPGKSNRATSLRPGLFNARKADG